MKIVSMIMIVFMFQLFIPISGQAAPSVSANNAVLIEQSTGRVLYEKGAHEKQSIASITKIMTAIIAIESGKMDEKAKVSREAIYTEGSSIYLEEGERITTQDLVYGLMLRSGNDAAVAIAEHVGGSEEGFVFLMNEKAKWLGMTNTHFDNPHGLDSDNHYSSAYDMAILMQYAMKNDTFKKITGTTSYRSENRSYAWQNKNKLLTQLYEYCTGGKTGFTKKTGRTLVSSASKDGMNLIAVTLDAPDDWRDHISMFEYGFTNYELDSLQEQGEINFNILDLSENTMGYFHEDIKYPLTEQEVNDVSTKNYVVKNFDEVGEGIIGKAIFYLHDEKISEAPIYTKEIETEKEDSLVSDIIQFYKKVIGM
ncbi:D-alanyl-D-alanine carboxypeptidase family protein [Oceanobacillus bengalensis]|uniref:D-alanyl-D-alanine carboxypeptidase n=1 Tax=Oceanobacillus bengalensis TaxID=1435466 RepID=A0A494Z1D4_9BACI|nr:D-alanyl-D-alanine carboxypeptidase family protein [Oceanobacillus bengalensis]RKQ16105.1 D-alanyl-D-alanine carboxypeptidase [Oceanobacillus bengalensis]